MDRMGYDVGIDIYKMMDLAEDIVAPLIQGTQEITKGSLALGYAGVYSSFLLHAERAGKRFGIDPRDILDRKSTRLNSSHVAISYAVFCLKKKKDTNILILRAYDETIVVLDMYVYLYIQQDTHYIRIFA